MALPAAMEKVKIPRKVLLDAMMHQLGLPKAVYLTQEGRPAGIDATIHFYAYKHQMENKLPRRSLSIHVHSKLEEAEEQLATEALRCMKGSYSKVIQDLNYDKLQLVQVKCKCLEHQQKERDGIIDYLSNDWCTTLSGDRMAAKELYRIIDTNLTAGSTSKDNDLNHILTQVKYVAGCLSDTTTQSEYELQQTNKYYWSLDDDIEGISALGNDNYQSKPLWKVAWT